MARKVLDAKMPDKTKFFVSLGECTVLCILLTWLSVSMLVDSFTTVRIAPWLDMLGSFMFVLCPVGFAWFLYECVKSGQRLCHMPYKKATLILYELKKKTIRDKSIVVSPEDEAEIHEVLHILQPEQADYLRRSIGYYLVLMNANIRWGLHSLMAVGGLVLLDFLPGPPVTLLSVPLLLFAAFSLGKGMIEIS